MVRGEQRAVQIPHLGGTRHFPETARPREALGSRPVGLINFSGPSWETTIRWVRAALPRVVLLQPVAIDETHVATLRELGYGVEWRTISERLFVVARRDGQPIGWGRLDPSPDSPRKRNR